LCAYNDFQTDDRLEVAYMEYCRQLKQRHQVVINPDTRGLLLAVPFGSPSLPEVKPASYKH
jgi:hypothetical protein